MVGNRVSTFPDSADSFSIILLLLKEIVMNKSILVVALAALTLQGCATITRGTTQDISIQSIPSKASVKTSSGATCTTPCILKMKRNKAFTGTVSKQGFKPAEFVVNTAVSSGGTVGLAGNLIAGGVVGIVIDASSGAMYDLYPTQINTTLTR